MDLKLQEKRLIAQDTVHLRFVPIENTTLPSFQAGAHIDIVFAEFQRQYSLVSSPDDLRAYDICVHLAEQGRGGSSYLVNKILVGETINLLSVNNAFSLTKTATHTVLIAGGIGITPLLSMAQALHQDGRSFELHYINHDAARRLPLPAAIERNTLHYTGRTGLKPFDSEALFDAIRPTSHVFACGPVALLSALKRGAESKQFPLNQFHVESFGLQFEASDKEINLHLLRSDLRLRLAPGKSILDTLLENGVWAGYECRRGQCGACLTGVVSGKPIHRDSISQEQRGDNICTCVSWASSEDLVLDL